MRILFFITKSEAGGAQTHVAQLTRWLIEHGHEVAVMSAPSFAEASHFAIWTSRGKSQGNPGGWLEEEAVRLGARFFANDWLSNSPNPLRLWKSSRRFLCAVHDFKPDIVACHSTMAGLVGRFSLRGRVPTIFTAHGWGFTQGAPLLRQVVLPIFERLAGRYSKKIICVSRNDLGLARMYRIAHDDKLALVYNGIELTQKSDDSTQAEACGYHNKRNDDRVHILFVGRLAPPKNPFLLVKAFTRLPRDLQDRAHLTIIGDGPDRPRLEALISRLHLTNHVELTGALPREDVLERLRSQADIFTLISHWEGFPYSVLEAMAAGVCVIASHVGGIPEALEEGGGVLIDNDSLEQLTNALALLITDDALRARMGIAARQTVVSQFFVENMCEQTFAIYHDAPKGAKNSWGP